MEALSQTMLRVQAGVQTETCDVEVVREMYMEGARTHRRGAKVPQSRRAKVPQSRNTDLHIMESQSPKAKANARWQTMDIDLFLTPAQWRHGEIIDGAVGAVAGDNPSSSTARPHTAVAATRPSTAVAATLSDSHFRFLALLPQSRQR